MMTNETKLYPFKLKILKTFKEIEELKIKLRNKKIVNMQLISTIKINITEMRYFVIFLTFRISDLKK